MAFGDFTVVRSTVKRVLNSSGVLASVAVNTPAFEFNADGSYKGLLVEPAATNLLLRSDNFDNASWVKTGTTVTSNVMTGSAGTTFKAISQAQTTQGLQTFFFDVEYINHQWIQLLVGTQGNDIMHANIDIQNKVVGGTGGTITATVQDFGTFTRVTATLTTANKTGVILALVNGTASVRGEVTSSTGSVQLYRAQNETGSVATSYIPTVGSTVTRGADDISLTSASSLIGQGQGTIYMEVDWRFESSAFAQVFLQIWDGTTNNRIELYNLASNTSINMFIESNDVIQVDQGVNSSTYTGIVKLALAYAQNDAVLFKNGASISADASVDLSAFGTLTEINLGSASGAVLPINMWIRSVALFPTRLSNSQLASLTTL